MGIRRGSISTPIIADGLVFNMDAANRACYPSQNSSGTNLIDSLQLRTGTLGSNASFDSFLGNGIFDFDGSTNTSFSDNSPTSFPNGNLSSGITLGCWFNRDTTTQYQGLISYGTAAVDKQLFLNFSSNATRKLKCGFYSNDFENASGTTISTGVWYYGVMTYDGTTRKIYLNGNLDGSDTPSSPNITLNGTMYLGRVNSHYFVGQMGPTHIYNRALSANEVLHNYNALKSRFE